MAGLSSEQLGETRACHCLAARKRARELTRRYERALRPHGLRATQFSVLAALAQAGPVPTSRLAVSLGLERTTLTRVAKTMIRNGWLSVQRGEDERVRILAVTSAGKNLLTESFPSWKRVQDAVTRDS
jgi:DNA-binding MarR family transcriptional regulator